MRGDVADLELLGRRVHAQVLIGVDDAMLMGDDRIMPMCPLSYIDPLFHQASHVRSVAAFDYGLPMVHGRIWCVRVAHGASLMAAF